MAYIIHRIKKHWGFRKAWKEGLACGIIEVARLRAKYPNPKEHKPAEDN